jgi:hypothetical protein
MTFRFAGAAAQVCKHCNFVVARKDRGLVAVGRMADLVEIPSPLVLGATGRWGNEPFVVDGRVQMDRVGAPGAPWQEVFIAFPASGRWCWVASAQGRWYATSEVPAPPGLLPLQALRPGQQLTLPGHGTFTVAEVGQRRVISGEGELPEVPEPGAVTGFADIAAEGGRFGTLDYGDGRSPPKLYLGSQIDPATFRLDSGAPLEAASAPVAAVSCPSCGGNLPLVASATAERVVCRYCGMTSDLHGGVLRALKPAPRPPVSPYVPLGAEGQLRGGRVICIGFVVRGCTVDGERYRWREYLLYAGPSAGYIWLMEEDGAWSVVTPMPPGEVQIQGSVALHRGTAYALKQSVQASVEHVVGEFYWKVEIGESVRATEYAGPSGKISVETAPTEVSISFVAPSSVSEIARAFNLPMGAAPSATAPGCAGSSGTIVIIVLVVLFILLSILGDCDGGGGGYVSPGTFGGGK